MLTPAEQTVALRFLIFVALIAISKSNLGTVLKHLLILSWDWCYQRAYYLSHLTGKDKTHEN